MRPDRLMALTDGVVAIAITIIVLELPVPEEPTLAGLRATTPMLLAYLLSFINIGIFWNNHHHMMAVVKKVDGGVLWANLSMLFFVSLFPFVIRWIDEAGFAALPCAAYRVVLTGASISYQAIERGIMRVEGEDSALRRAVGIDVKAWLSAFGYLAAIGLAFVNPFISIAIYIVVAVAWFVPDRRIEKEHYGKR